MSSFFTTPASQRKRKRQDGSSKPSKRKQNSNSKSTTISQPKSKSRSSRDDSISGSDSEDATSPHAADAADDNYSYESGSELGETAAERRLKLAERYLESVRAEVAEDGNIGFDAEEIDRELIAARLQEDVAQDKGRIYRHIAAHLDYGKATLNSFRADTLSTTGVAVCLPFIYTVHKDMSLIKWALPTTQTRRTKPTQVACRKGSRHFVKDAGYKHHTAAILCIAASPDGKFLATGGADRRMILWDAATLNPLKVFTQHRDAVTAVSFRGKMNQLFTASRDRTIKIWSANDLAYVETLFGHQDEVVDVAAVDGTQERCVSVGARDRTARLWKVVEESQLVFRGGGMAKTSRGRDETEALAPLRYAEGSLDRVIQLDTQLFVTGSDSGALSLYALHKKKALHTVPLAHGVDPPLPLELASAEVTPRNSARGLPTPRWITALAAVPFSDLFVSGSWDGWVRVWRVSADMKKIEPVAALGQVDLDVVDARLGPVRGIVNDLAICEKGDRGKGGLCVVAAVGTEGRLGRWKTVKGRNGAVLFDIPRLLDARSNGTLAEETAAEAI